MNKIDKLVDILKRLNSSERPESVRQEAKDFLAAVEPDELALAEQKLVDEGLSLDNLRQLCSIHIEMMEDQLQKMKDDLKAGHVIHTMLGEHELILGFLNELKQINLFIQHMQTYDENREEFAKLKHIAKHLLEAESHHQREEEVLFPQLEERGVTGPPHIMRLEHNELRSRKKDLKDLADNVNRSNFDEFKKRLDSTVKFIIPTLTDHIFKENNILYPAALKIIKGEHIWNKMKSDCDKIGYCCFTPEPAANLQQG